VKTTVAIIFSLLLAWSQTIAISASQSAATKHCCGCACVEKTCCAAKSSSESQPQPAAPNSVRASSELTLLPANVLALRDPLVTVSEIQFPSSLLAHAKTIPLYRQNCSILV